MLPTVLSLAESRLRLHLNVVRLNQEHPTRSHTRVGSDGLTKTVITRPKALCDGAKTTGVLLLQRARKQAISMLANPLHRERFISPNGETLPDVPPIEVNGRELSQKRGLTDRALRNHLAQLKQVGIIVKRKFRGTRASFHVWMNPELVWVAPHKPVETAVDSVASNPNKSSISSPKSKIVPDIKVLEHLETIKREITYVDKPIVETGNPLLETEARNGRAFRRKKNEAAGGGTASSLKSELSGEEARDHAQLRKMNYVSEFWEHAKTLVYPGLKWTKEQERLAKNAIWTGVFKGFHNYGDFDWNSIQLAMLQRLQLVRDHLRLHPERYAPLPYSQYKPGSGYFDIANTSGFAGTAAWLQKVNKRKQSLIVDRALRAAITEIDQHNKIARTPEIKLRTHERVRSLSLLQLIKHHESGLKRLGDAKALDRFYAKVGNKVSKSTFKTIQSR